MAQMRGSPLRQDLNNCIYFDKGVYIVNYVTTLFSQGERTTEKRERHLKMATSLKKRGL